MIGDAAKGYQTILERNLSWVRYDLNRCEWMQVHKD